MKKFLPIFCAILFVLGVGGAASAIPATDLSAPVSMFMFGTGLIGVAFIGKKKFGKVKGNIVNLDQRRNPDPQGQVRARGSAI
jgi:hypothetical protein